MKPIVAASLCVGITAASAFAGLEDSSYTVPLNDDAVGYHTLEPADPIAKLQKRLDAGKASLQWDDRTGYLKSVLKLLDASVSSQSLVFSKTSFQLKRITPQKPRALYFGDETYAGWVQGGDVIELAAIDPTLGAVFYTLDQVPTDKPQFVRNDQCLQCHQSPKTAGVPGLTLRSVRVEPDGQPILSMDHFTIDHRSPVEQRWGGWYVTGTHGDTPHLGNALTRKAAGDQIDPANLNVTDLSKYIDTDPYLTPHSDIVGLMVLEHQGHMHNLLTRASYEVRMALRDQAAMDKALGRAAGELSESTQSRIRYVGEAVLRYMLLADEPLLEDRITGTSTFAVEFQKKGPFDKKGRSLRQLDLRRSLFEYPCSYVIYSPQWDAMPAPLRDYLYRRLHGVLTGKDTTGAFRISTAKRRAILEILAETKKGLPTWFKPDPAARAASE